MIVIHAMPIRVSTIILGTWRGDWPNKAMLRCGRLFVRDGGTQKANPNGEGLSNIRELEPWQAVAEDTDGGYSYLKTLPTVRSDRLGLVGFCWGGEMTFASPTEVRRLEAVVVFLRTPTAAGAAGKNSGARALPLR